jgi:Secretion system C-terminal sorting domain
MKKITLLLALMITSLGYSQPTSNAPIPTKLSANVLSVYGDAYTNIETDLNPNWGQSGFGLVNKTFNPTGVTTNPNYAYFMDNLNYQGMQFSGQNLVSAGMEKLHIDIWTPNCSSFEVYLIAPGPIEKQVTLTPTLSGWNSYDIALTEYSNQNLPLTNIFQFKFVGTPFGTSKVYLDNIYFWKTPPPAGTPTIGALTVPAKKVGDASFNLTDPTSNSTGAFSYTSSNTAVATISGKTVTIVGAGSSTITANQAAASPYLAGSVTANLVVSAVATGTPTTPPSRPAADVVSIYSNAYTNISPINLDAGWCGGGAIEATIVSGNDVLAYKGNACQGITFPSDPKNLTGFTNIHVDFFIATGTDLPGKVFNLKTVALNGSAVEINLDINTLSPVPVPGTWYSFDRAFTTGELSAIAANPIMHEFGVTSNMQNSVWYDNLYLHKNTLGTTQFETAKVKMYPNPMKNILTVEANSEIQRVSVYNILGQEVLKASPKSNSATLQTNELQKGVYMVTTQIDGKVSTSKMVKE